MYGCTSASESNSTTKLRSQATDACSSAGTPTLTARTCGIARKAFQVASAISRRASSLANSSLSLINTCLSIIALTPQTNACAVNTQLRNEQTLFIDVNGLLQE
jgi:hypothetical protein